jgi:hypothetical protein
MPPAADSQGNLVLTQHGWTSVTGEWSWEEGKLVQSAVPDAYSMIVRDETLLGGRIAVEGSATAANSSGDGCIGIICKYIDRDNWVAVRYGAYGGIMVAQSVAGERRFSRLRPFTCEIGRRYTCEVWMAEGVIVAGLDGKSVAVVEDPLRDAAGRPGLWSQSAAEFYRMAVDDAHFDDVSATAAALFGSGPRIVDSSDTWSLEHVEYSVAPLSPTIGRIDLCTLALYVRNRGDVACSLTDITLDGELSAELIQRGRIAWWRSWPEIVPPGAVAQILVKMSEMALSEAAQVGRRAPVGPYRVGLVSGDRDDLEVEFALQPAPAPLRINFIAFGRDLDELCAYVAAEDELVGKRVVGVEVNGEDVTAGLRSRLGDDPAMRLRVDVLPLCIRLSQPLAHAEPTVVTVCAEDGTIAGHAVRALPSRFPVQVVILGKQPGAEEVAELANLCFTDVGLCGGRTENIPAMSDEGLSYFPYAYPSAQQIDQYLSQSPRPALSGWWIDEIDGWKKRPIDAQTMLQAADEGMRERGIPIAPYCMNIMAPWNDEGYIELADALSHEYGIDRGIKGLGGPREPLDFGHPGDIASREFRIARKPWWPYFRNIEAVLLLEPGTKQVVGHYRPIDPREHRLYVYSCLANGAKGALHWNYGVNYLPASETGWFSKEHDAIRLNMTALKETSAYGVDVPGELLAGLRDATDECARVNAELQLLGPLLAMGDVSDLAEVTRSSPEKSVRGGPAAHARAIVCGIDTVVLLVINLNIDSNFNARKPQPVGSYEPVNAEVDLEIPPWLEPRDVFSVSCRGIEVLEPAAAGDSLHLQFRRLAASGAVVVTADRSLRPSMTAKLAELQERLRAAGVELQ